MSPRQLRAGLASLVLLVLAIVAVSVLGNGTTRGRPDDLLDAELRAYADARPIRIGWYRGGEPVSIWRGDEVAGGYAVEEWNLLAIKLGIAITHVPFDQIGDVVGALRDGTIDIAGGLGNRPDVQAIAERTEPFALERITFVGALEQAGRELGTLAGRSVSTIPGSPLVFALLSAYPETNLVESESIAAGLRATAAGEIDLFLSPLAIAGYAMRTQDLELVPVGDTIQSVPVSAWALRGSQALALARAARAQLTDEDIALATLRWTGFDLSPARDGTPTWVRQLLLAALALAVVLGGFAFVLRRQVRVATSALSQLNVELEARVEARTQDLDDAVARLERSNEALSGFAHTVAHDLRGPVGAIAGFAELLRGDKQVDPDDREQMLNAMASSSKRLIGMVDGLLEDAARVGARSSHMTAGAFTAWLPEVLGPEVRRAGADLRVQVDVDDPETTVPVDSIVLQRTAINLAGNALKYGQPPDGQQACVEVRLAPSSAGAWALEVDDNGPGIPVELREDVFQLGFRAQYDTRGHGLGLAETRELVSRLGGTIEVGDSPLGGARFTVSVPAAEA